MAGQQRFALILVKPSHYDNDGYVIQSIRSAVPSNSLAVVNGLALDCKQRRVLGDDVEIAITSMDEDNTRIRQKRIVQQLAGSRGLVMLGGVQSNQFPRAMDIARPLRAAGVQVCIGGFAGSCAASLVSRAGPRMQEGRDLAGSAAPAR